MSEESRAKELAKYRAWLLFNITNLQNYIKNLDKLSSGYNINAKYNAVHHLQDLQDLEKECTWLDNVVMLPLEVLNGSY